jgi:hypothetical protein
MADYYSNEVKILDNVVQINATIDSKGIVSVNYGADASSEYTFEITKSTITGTVTVSDSTSGATPNIYWTYEKNGVTNVIDENSSLFSFETTGGFTGSNATFNCTLTIDEDADLGEWGNIEVYLNVDPYTEGLFTWNTLPAGGFAFETNWGTPPTGVAFYPNLSNQLLSGNSVSLATGIYSYESIATAIWQYSDDDKVTWNTVITETHGQITAMSTSLSLTGGYGDVGTPPSGSRTSRSDSLTVSDLQFSEGRFYRIKVTIS